MRAITKIILPAVIACTAISPVEAQAQTVEESTNNFVHSARDQIAATATHVGDQVNSGIDNAYNTVDPFIDDSSPQQAQIDAVYSGAQNAVNETVENVHVSIGVEAPSTNESDTGQGQNPQSLPTAQSSTQSAPVPHAVQNENHRDTLTQSRSSSVVPTAHSMLGAQGYDCSGFVQAAYAKQGIDIPRTSYQQRGVGTPVAVSDVQPGDIVFFYGNSHVGIYVGNGQVIHSPGAGHSVVYENMAYMPADGATRL